MLWARHLLSTEDLRKRAEDLQKLRQKHPERQPKNRPPRPKRPRRNRYRVRTDSGPIALRAFWSMHVEAMNWSCHSACNIDPLSRGIGVQNWTPMRGQI